MKRLYREIMERLYLNYDKLLHFSMSMNITIMLFCVIGHGFWAMLIALAIGIAWEVLNKVMGNRPISGADIAADLIGAASAIVMLVWLGGAQ